MKIERTKNQRFVTGHKKGAVELLSKRRCWQEDAMAIIRSYPHGQLFTSDAVRKEALLTGIGQPHHPHAWGSLFCAAARLFIIRKTGRYFPSEIESNHGSVIAEWMRI
jgi:hypothetical protein